MTLDRRTFLQASMGIGIGAVAGGLCHSGEAAQREEEAPWFLPDEQRRPMIESYWHSLPSFGQDCPRDNQRIERGEDILFLAVVLKHFKPSVRSLKRFAMPGTRQQRYLLEREDGVLLSPVTLEETRPDDGWMLKQTMFARSLRRRIRQRFYVYRRALLDYLRATIIVNGRTLTTEGERQDGYSEFMELLRWPVALADDPILDHLPERKFLEFNATQVASSLDAICPLDGPVRPLLFEIVSPKWTWEHLCGRHYAYALCPSCLGTFTGYLATLN